MLTLAFSCGRLPRKREASVLTHLHPCTRWLTAKDAPLFTGPPWSSDSSSCQAPRAPVHVPGVPSHVMVSGTRSVGHYPTFLAPTDSCASPQPSAGLGDPSVPRSVQGAVSPCWEEDLPGVISATLSLRAWTPTPAAPVVPMPVSSHRTTAFPALGPGRRLAKTRTATSVRNLYRGCSHLLMFRPADLLATLVAPTAVPHGTEQLWLLHPRLFRIVTFPNSGHANRPFRATDGRGTYTLQDSQPFRLLP